MTEGRRRAPVNPEEFPGYLEKIQGMSREAALAVPYVKKQGELAQKEFTESLTSIALFLEDHHRGAWRSLRPLDCIEEIEENFAERTNFYRLVQLSTQASAEKAIANYLFMEQSGTATMQQLRDKQRTDRAKRRQNKASIYLQGGKSETHSRQAPASSPSKVAGEK